MENASNNGEVIQSDSTMRLRDAVLRYASCLFVLMCAIGIDVFYITLGAYIISGIFLNRTVLRKLVDWHPVYNTLYSVTSNKIHYFLFWPFTYFGLFARLGVDRIL